MSKLPKITIIIPVRLGAVASVSLDSIKKADYPKNLIEIMVVEGNQPSKQRNEAIRKAKGDIIYFLDDDSHISKNCLKTIAKEFSNPKLDVLGGPSLIDSYSKNFFNRVIAYILETYFGALRMRARYSKNKSKKATEYDLISANLAVRKNVLKKEKFDEMFYPNEETELLRRLQDKGFVFKYNNKLVVYRNHRKNIFELIEQFRNYGRGRMMQIKKIPKLSDFIFSVPIGFLFYIFSLLFFHPSWYLIPLATYFLLSFLTSLKATLKYKEPSLLLSMTLLFPIIHLSYALGLIEELLFSTRTKENSKNKMKYISRINIVESS